MRSWKEREEKEGDENEEVFDEMRQRQGQIKAWVGAECVASVVQFIWDYSSLQYSSSVEDCQYYYEAQSVTGVAWFVVLKGVTLLVVPMTVYVAFFRANRQQFNNRIADQLTMDVFFDNRSNLIRYSSTQELQNINK